MVKDRRVPRVSPWLGSFLPTVECSKSAFLSLSPGMNGLCDYFCLYSVPEDSLVRNMSSFYERRDTIQPTALTP